MPSWFTQNLQRRLLLYFLQKVSLFSQVDISALDVSLGSSSNFTFHDLDLDVENIEIPDISVRSGFLKQLELRLTVSGGLNVEGSGVSFVVKPNLSKAADAHAASFSLSKTVYDLTSSVMQLDGGKDNVFEEESAADETNSELDSQSQDSGGTGSPSVLQAMRNKAIGVILSKLSIILRDVSFKFVFAQNTILELKLEEVICISSSDTREVKISGIRLCTTQNAEKSDEEGINPNPDSPLSDSLLYSKGEATSLYMSAIQSMQETDDKSGIDFQGKDILDINFVHVSFEGFTSIEDITLKNAVVEFDMCKLDIAALLTLSDPILLPIIHFIIDRTKESNHNRATQTPQHLQNYKRFREEQDLHDELQFSRLIGSQLILILSDVLELTIEEICISANGSELLGITVSDIGITHNGSNIFTAVEQRDVPLIESSFDLSENHITTKINKPLLLRLNSDTLFDIINSSYNVSKCLESWNQSISKKGKKGKAATTSLKIALTSSPLEVEMEVSDQVLRMVLCEYSFSLPSQVFKTQMISFEIESKGEYTQLMKVSNIDVKRLSYPAQHEAFNHCFDEVMVCSKLDASIECLEFSVPVEVVENVVSQMMPIFEQISILAAVHGSTKGTRQKSQRHMRRSVRIMGTSSIISKHSSAVYCFLHIGNVEGYITKFLESAFGNIWCNLGPCSLYINEDKTFTIYAKDFGLTRQQGNQSEILVEALQPSQPSKPVLTVHKKLTGKVCCAFRSIAFHYNARWLDLFQHEGNESSLKESKIIDKEVENKFLEFKFTECAIRLSPYRLKTQLLFILGKCALEIGIPQLNAKGTLRSISILLIDDTANFRNVPIPGALDLHSFYTESGFANIGKLDKSQFDVSKRSSGLHVGFQMGTVSLSLCADSIQALTQTFLDLGIPLTFADDKKYMTKIPQVEVFQEVDNEFFTKHKFQSKPSNGGNEVILTLDDFIDRAPAETKYMERATTVRSQNSEHGGQITLAAQDNYFTDKKDSPGPQTRANDSIISIEIELTLELATLKLYDGYDWMYTRKSISDLLNQIETVLIKQKPAQTQPLKASVFDSIYLFAGVDTDADTLRQQINQDLQSEPNISFKSSSKKPKLRPSKTFKATIELSNLKSTVLRYNVDDPTESTSDMSTDILNEVELSVENFEVIDNVPTSTWNKLATFWREEPRARGSDMLSVSIKTVKPIDFLAATELIMDVKVLPLRLHIDQDTLDFLTRFFEFKDSRFELIDEYPDFVYIQKLEVGAVNIKMDYKPKTVDYSGLKSGHTSEFMNFFILEGSKLKLRHVVVYGVNGFPELNKILNGIWMPDITGHQLKGILSGVAPMKTAVTLGSGVKALITTPLKEYKRDQNLGRGVQKGTQVFIKITSGEFIRLGVKLASGTQAVLENAEELMGGIGSQGRGFNHKDFEVDVVSEQTFKQYEKLVGGRNPIKSEEELEALIVEPGATEKDAPRIFSLYADQPTSLKQGLKEARGSFGNNVQLAYDAVRKAQREIRETNNVHGTASSLARVVPVALLRPIIGATEALSKALQGISNGIDDEQLAMLQDKYKSRS
ncbi:LADA_0B00364g1_1 [Lachancea dasiensis]|uniref:Autophagy-related protein 2 n=1 Tax=Lachancea dasiensis TaxID=1072105 RepID=A0A1G4IRD7_9SACH|nr:LADA_0B00364g1_1 [Lachancea dasiensis]